MIPPIALCISEFAFSLSFVTVQHFKTYMHIDLLCAKDIGNKQKIEKRQTWQRKSPVFVLSLARVRVQCSVVKIIISFRSKVNVFFISCSMDRSSMHEVVNTLIAPVSKTVSFSLRSCLIGNRLNIIIFFT